MTELQPVVTSSSEATPMPFLATVPRLLIPTAKTGGVLPMLDAGVVPAGFSPPLRFHRRGHELLTIASPLASRTASR
ncbi:hypothetical protein SAMN05216188_13159 [Lentzea xinjiangensis]|uniref:Uncharacterized protein n=1 Tax=Lentzea xinjiangensis TaxID=402600 RepID=A0A1H9W8Z8_9PSEU|nr:hypothetical protein [Lentzea xinjiangensis]SES30249.1 hypothetical protein SAMN05216188_13159 [Lentzea xinjiangensis]